MANRPVRNSRMGSISQILLVGSNLALAGAVWFIAFRPPAFSPQATGSSGEPSPPGQPPVGVSGPATPDFDAEALRKSIATLTLTMQGFNTTLVQYDYLQREIARLREVDELLGQRLREIHATHKTQPSDQTRQTMETILNNQTQIRGQIDKRRGDLQKLLTQLERRQNEGQRPLPAPGQRPAAQIADPSSPPATRPAAPVSPAGPGTAVPERQ